MITHTRLPALASAITLGALAATGPAHSQDLDLGTIVVSPSRTPIERAKVGSKVEKIEREEIESKSLPVVTDYLNLEPGVEISSPGGPGTEGSLSVRGAPKRYVKTLYNGIDIADPTSTQVQTSYQYLLAGAVDDIEVLKGSQSTLYGSEAIAGVISISTLQGIEPGVTHLLHGEGGSNGTARGSYGLRAADEEGKGEFGLNVTGFRTDGISAASAGTERDGYENVTFDAGGEYRFSDAFSVFGSALLIDGEAEFDNDGFVDAITGNFISPSDNLTATNLSRQLAGRMGFNLDLMDGRFRNTVSMQTFDLERTIEGTGFDGVYEGRRYKFDYQGAFDLNERLTIQGGADHEQQDADFPAGQFNPAISSDFDTTGLWAEAIAEPVENMTLTAGLRHDEHSEFGGHTTYRATGSYLFAETGTRLHGSFGTGFRAPSLNELFGPFGANPDLDPETSVGYDIGVEQQLLGGRLIADVTYFALDIDDLIGFTNAYHQIDGTSEMRGVEASLDYAVNGWLDVGGSYTYTDARDQTGERLVRVPRHAVGLSATARPWEKWSFSAAAKVAVDTVDTGSFELDDYVLVNARVAYKPTEDTELYVRAENVLDQDYETVRGFGTKDFSVFAGFRARFGP